MASLSGADQSWGEASAASIAAAVKATPDGNFVISMYLSLDPSKNVTAADVKRYHGAGAGMKFNWEHQAGAPLLGAAQGKADATEAVRQLRAIIQAVGYAPRNRLTIDFSCDRDVTAAQIAGPIADYYRAARDVCHAAGFGVGVYGEASLVHYLAEHGITDGEWQTYAWSGGVLDPAADFYQYQNGQTLGGASVDFDRIIHASALGAWWPPAHPLNTQSGDEPVTPAEITAIANAVYNKVLNTDNVIESPDAATSSNKFWTWKSHVITTTRAAQTAARLAASLLTRVVALQADVTAGRADVAALRAEVQAMQAGEIHVHNTSVPVTGTLTVGGAL